MALVFPATPAVGDTYPSGGGIAGVSQWTWDGSKWSTVPVFVKTNNQQSFNGYQWPTNASTQPGYQLTDLLANGQLTWERGNGELVYLDDISSQFDGIENIFVLNIGGVPYVPSPQSNLLIILGGIAQVPGISYLLSGSQITFSGAPAQGASFIGITNLIT